MKSQFCEGCLDQLEGFQSLKNKPSDYTDVNLYPKLKVLSMGWELQSCYGLWSLSSIIV